MLPLDYIAKLIMVLVVVAVVVMLMVSFSIDIPKAIDSFWKKPAAPQTNVVEQATFSAQEVALFAESCWSQGEVKRADHLCHVLRGTLDATPDEINASLQPGLRNKVSVETGKGAPSVVVRYSYLEGLVTIK